MKKVIEKIKWWLFAAWAKKQIAKRAKMESEMQKKPSPILGSTNEHLSDQDKKDVIKEFNKKQLENDELNPKLVDKILEKVAVEHPKILQETVRSSKPKYNNSITEELFFNGKSYRLTKKQLFFINLARKQNSNEPINFHEICLKFLEQKYLKGSEEFQGLSKEKFKPKYHKKTIRHLASLDLIYMDKSKNWHLTK